MAELNERVKDFTMSPAGGDGDSHSEGRAPSRSHLFNERPNATTEKTARNNPENHRTLFSVHHLHFLCSLYPQASAAQRVVKHL